MSVLSPLSRGMLRAVGFSALAIAAVQATPAWAQSGDLVVNSATAPSSLDPAWACGLPEISFLQNFYVRLVQYGVKDGPEGTKVVDYGTIEPYLADSWTVSEDGKVYTFKLKDGFKFQSGAPIDAAAVKYSFDRVLKMAGCGRFFLTDGFIDPVIIDSVEAPDASTVVITLNRPNANMLVDWATHAGSIVDPAVVEANGGVVEGQPNQFMSSNVTASGPFLLEAYTPNQSARMVANPAFAGEAPASSAIQVNWIAAAPTLLLQARTGQADITFGISKQAATTLKDSQDVRVLAYTNPFVQQMMLPNSKAPWDNPKVREAVAHAVPYQQIVDRIAYGYGTLYYGPIPPSLPGFNADLSKPVEFDLDKAKALLAESGVTLPIEVEVLVQEGDATQQQIATVLQSTWADLGINLKIRVAPGAEYQDLTQGHKVQSLMRLDGPGVFEAGYYFGYDVMCNNPNNLTEYCDPAVDGLVNKLRATADATERQAILDEITTKWRAAYPKLQFFEDQPVVVLSKAVTDFTFAPLPDYRTWRK
ncbi:ABC transporter substrate-binding protein [Paradevosia shaoguanensis]|uniref:ABC transporter substrate-binding protein n=1 Tax=Paradevosia shaoguanensis TaxID=1335043 RepID=A0AA41QM73_9HYPH|nr:ABC transporter substrate-binding protein [Paradevosia shaoguanensis]MCF1742225.1 ABC transporter substrate-binding protein [Paradevosia shaoguanensis]MCI0126708.1 ABC transporter substrate-binding protein [Paradevosia shaoguanensis]